MTGALHVLQLLLAPVPPLTSLAAAKSRTVQHKKCKQDQILKTMTKITRPRPRPPEVNKGT